MRLAMTWIALLLVLGCQSEEERQAAHAERAAEYFEAQQWKEAKIEYLNLLQLDPDSGEVNFQLGEVQTRLGEYADALWRYREAVRLDPAQGTWRVRLAGMLLAAQRVDDAREHSEEALKLAPDDPEVLLVRARIHGLDDELDLMLERLNGVLAKTADVEDDEQSRALQTAAFTLKARLHNQRQEFDAAESALRDFTAKQDEPGPHLLLAVFLVDRERPDEARAEYRAAIDSASEDQRLAAQFAMASFLYSREDFDAAEKVLIEAHEESPEKDDPALRLARFYHQRGRLEDAAGVLEEAAKLRPDEPGPLLVIADYHRLQGDNEKALDAIDRALALQPDLENARVARAEFLMDQRAERPEAADEARDIIASVLEDNPDSTLGLFARGKFLLVDGEYEDAVNHLRRVVQELPSAAAHLMLATAYRAMGQSDLARSELLAAVRLEEANVQARRLLAQLYLEEGNFQLAIQEAEAALRRNPNDHGIALLRARALASLGKRDQALAAMNAIEFEDGEQSYPLRLAAAGLYLQLDDGARVIESTEVVLEADPANPQALHIWATEKARQGDPQIGLARVEEAIEAKPDEAVLYELRAALRLAVGTSSEEREKLRAQIISDLKLSMEKAPDRSEPHVLLARLHIFEGNVDEADKSLRRAIELQPNNSGAHVMRAEMLERAGRVAEARTVYEEVVRLDPQNVGAKNNLAWLLASSESPTPDDLDRAQDLAQDAKEANPDNAAIADTLGWVMLKKRIPRAAIALFREAVGKAPNSFMRATARYHLALAYEQTGEAQKAIAELEIAISEDQNWPDRGEAEATLTRLRTG